MKTESRPNSVGRPMVIVESHSRARTNAKLGPEAMLKMLPANEVERLSRIFLTCEILRFGHGRNVFHSPEMGVPPGGFLGVFIRHTFAQTPDR